MACPSPGLEEPEYTPLCGLILSYESIYPISSEVTALFSEL